MLRIRPGSSTKPAGPPNPSLSQMHLPACMLAVGCSVDLRALQKPYCLKKGLCPTHIKAPSLHVKGIPGTLYRFCQQCG
ncbi:hypothetical protein OEZ86_007329 [Tetradesmus obliquus]|nr:hypothetical protein OEZ86_007329 [Tetradesmus obliquus]